MMYEKLSRLIFAETKRKPLRFLYSHGGYVIYHDISLKRGRRQGGGGKERIAEHAARVLKHCSLPTHDSAVIYLPQKKYRKSIKARSS